MTLNPAYGGAPAQGGGAGGLDFSTTEQDTGQKYLGAETIYEKTITFSAGPNNELINIAHGISNLGRIVDIQGFMDDGTLQRNVNNMEATVSAQAHYAIDDTNIIFLSGIGGDFSGYNGFFKLRYLKTA